MKRLLQLLAHMGRVVSIVVLASVGSAILMRYAPGYLADSRELDAAHAGLVREQLRQLQTEQATLPKMLQSQTRAWLHGDLGQSRHYDVPVTELMGERYSPTLRLLASGMALGWLLALAFAVPLSMGRRSRARAQIGLLAMLATATLLAVPVGVLATFSLLLNKGGPVLTLALLVAVREFKLLHSLLVAGWRAPHMFHARAQGFSQSHSLRVHLLRTLRPELLNLLGMSAIVALSALVPVEVIFDVPGLGQLAWASAINRDLPVLVAMTALMAMCVSAVGLLLTQQRSNEAGLSTMAGTTEGLALCE